MSYVKIPSRIRVGGQEDCVHLKLGLCRVDHKPCVPNCGIYKTKEDRIKYLRENGLLRDETN